MNKTLALLTLAVSFATISLGGCATETDEKTGSSESLLEEMCSCSEGAEGSGDGLTPRSLHILNKNCTPVSQEQTCKVVDGIRVCDTKYVPGKYVCKDFSNDFAEEARKKGVPTWRLSYGCPGSSSNYAGWRGYDSFYHQVNVVEVEYPAPLKKYCVVEPQNNQNKGCWVQGEGDPVVPGFIQDELRKDPRFQKCISDGWNQEFNVFK